MAKMKNPIQTMIDKSIKELKANSKAVETALEAFLESEGIDVSEKEINEIKQLTNTMSELDKVLLSVQTKPVEKKKTVKKKKATRRKRK